jgi:hypothetical protein
MFFVLTQLQGEDNSPASVAELLQLSAPLTFHLSNGITTQLGDLSLFGVLRDNDQLEDEIARSPSDLQSLWLAPDSSVEIWTTAIFKVFANQATMFAHWQSHIFKLRPA